MRRLEHLPFKRKLTVITMMASGVALLLAGIGFTTYEVVVFRGTLLDHLGRTAQILGDNSSAAVAFRDPVAAEQTLRSLAAEPHIVAAAIYDEAGNVFATYRSLTAPPFDPPESVPPIGHHFGKTHLQLTRIISAGDDIIGAIQLVSDLREMRVRVWRYLLIALAVLATSSLGVLLLAHQLHKSAMRPISHLSAVAGMVASKRDYSVRARKETDDEVGGLIDAFNDMLGQIQLRDVELKAAHELLEERVAERTRQLEEEIAERSRSEAALRESNRRFEIVTRATTDVVWDWDIASDEIWWNENFQQVFGYRTESGMKSAHSWAPHLHPDEASHVVAALAAVLEGRDHLWSKEYRFRRADGGFATVLDRAYVLRDPHGNPTRMIGALQDVTERRTAEAELARTHRELVEASRRAGQADVATSVLHNVGNVLNSVIVSTTLAVDRLRGLRVEKIAQTGELLRQNEAMLGPFFTADPKGRALLDYLPQLARLLATERAGISTELELVRRHIAHIKEIVTEQQSLAKSVGVLEKVPLATVVDDALALNADSFERHMIAVERRYGEVPVFPVDKHSVLQILVNLIQNAKDAVKAGVPPGQRRIELELIRTAEQTVRIRVADNGVGIAPENLTRIFQHGFTTRHDGHGFGLHSGALAARKLGGRLVASSPGPGSGAAFTLEIPIQKDS